ncbi:MAG: hypothetical protein ACR2K1_05725 [Saprospiraceae bacterium]
MFTEILKKNWATTLIGVLLIAGAVGDGLVCFINGGGLFECVQSAWVQILAAVGFIAAKDGLTEKSN